MTTDGIRALREAFGQPAIQFLVGVVFALVLRGSGLLLLMLAGSLSRRVTQVRLSGLLEELTLYKFFERRPAVLMARAIELQLWTGVSVVAFCMIWALRGGMATSNIATLSSNALEVLLSVFTGWVLIDLFRLVRPISQFQRYEASTRDRIARMKARVLVTTRRLKTEQEQLEEMDENLKKMSGLAEGASFEDAPFFSEESDPAPAPASTATTVDAPPAPPTLEPKAESKAPPPSADTRPRPEANEAVAPARPPATDNGSVYQSAWMSGRVKRWPDGAPFGFIVADTGEQFFAGADNLAGLEPLEEGDVVLFQPVAGTPHRRAGLVCGIGSYGQGRVNGIRGNMGFITIQDSRRSASIYFRLPVGVLPTFDIGDTVGFRFGRNILGPTAERIDADLGDDKGAQWRRG
ncbi:MAG TPA: hypothetical protein VG943_00395 [Caulobacterales bacterium]|nr:hypothetical protein [Caulobacterales bacterium]